VKAAVDLDGSLYVARVVSAEEWRSIWPGRDKLEPYWTRSA